ncbi:MAG: twin-arginine translocation pathway signal, partial [Bacteroidia bacterium]|nr:twin-arginine translocation pathway signal [Bacteroidia bacterium]
MNRKEFIRLSSLLSASAFVPEFIQASARQLGNTRKRPLVIVQLSGGNDGLNTIIPYRNDIYYQLRPNISIELADALKLTDEFGIHSKLHGFKELYDAGYLSIIHNVGYPNPNRSHFRSMDIWQSACDAGKYVNTGWVGRWLDASCKNGCQPYYAIETDDALSLALKGELQKGLAFNHPAQFYSSAGNPIIQAIAKEESQNSSMNQQLAYLQKTLTEATTSAQYIH